MHRKTRMLVAGMVAVLATTIGGAAVADTDDGMEQATRSWCC